jgi:hypothetical protein
MRAVVLCAARRLGHRGALLTLLGGIALLYGVSLLTVPPSPPQLGLRFLLGFMSLRWWGTVLISAGAVAIVCAPFRQGRDWPGFAVLFLVWLPWSLSYLVSWWPQHDNHRGWVTAMIFAAFAAIPAVGATWDEPEPVPRTARRRT